METALGGFELGLSIRSRTGPKTELLFFLGLVEPDRNHVMDLTGTEPNQIFLQKKLNSKSLIPIKSRDNDFKANQKDTEDLNQRQ